MSAASQALQEVGVQVMHNVIKAPSASGESFKSQLLRSAITFKKKTPHGTYYKREILTYK